MIKVEGALSVKAALLAGRREVAEIVIDSKKEDRDTAFIIREAGKRNVTVKRASREEIMENTSGKTHGGIYALVSERRYQSLSEEYEEGAFYCILEGIEDPFNLGYCLRSMYAAGCRAVILAARRWESAEEVIIRSSAGASEYLAVVMSSKLQEEIDFLQARGYRLVSAHRKAAESIYETDLSGKICVAVGGEMRGLSRTVLEASDRFIYIPYGKDVRVALNASSATAVIAFEINRQRGIKYE